ncbi:hypothetical protein, partial [Thiolapillus sp.]
LCFPSGAMRTTGKQCGLAATGDYQPSLRSPWLAAGMQGAAFSEEKSTQTSGGRYGRERI